MPAAYRSSSWSWTNTGMIAFGFDIIYYDSLKTLTSFFHSLVLLKAWSAYLFNLADEWLSGEWTHYYRGPGSYSWGYSRAQGVKQQLILNNCTSSSWLRVGEAIASLFHFRSLIIFHCNCSDSIFETLKYSLSLTHLAVGNLFHYARSMWCHIWSRETDSRYQQTRRTHT